MTRIPLKNFLSLAASFIIMLCLGSVYAWSVFVPELKSNYGFTTTHTQLAFGMLIATFTLTMILAGRLERKYKPHVLSILAASFFSSGYLVAGLSKGNIFIVFLGIGVLTGIGTGFGYLVSITNPVKWVPDKKGLVTGICTAGFGLGAVVLTWLTRVLLESGSDVLEIFKLVGVSYGVIILLFSILIKEPLLPPSRIMHNRKIFTDGHFYLLLIGIFCGTFAGLLVIGNLKHMGALYDINNDILLLRIVVFSAANFAGRLIWGLLSDYLSGKVSIFLALSLLGIFVFLIGYIALSAVSYLILSAAIGFSFGANFVLFAKETAHLYGINNMGYIYPYIFLGYGLAGVLGPVIGGLIFDLSGNYSYGAYIAAILSITGAFILLFPVNSNKSRKINQTI